MCHVQFAVVTGRDGQAVEPTTVQWFGDKIAAPFFSVLLFVVLVLLASDHARGDWLNATGAETAPNFAEIALLDDRVRIALEIDFADFPIFVTGEKGGDVSRLRHDAEPDAAMLASFTGHAMKVQVDGESLLEPTLRRLEIRDRKDRPTARALALGRRSPPASPVRRGRRVVYAELDFVLTGEPKTLTFTPPLDREGRVLVTIGFLAHHGKVPVTDYRYLSVPEMIVLDWDDPWYSAFENPNLTRHHRSALMSFLTVEPREVRHEVIFRLRDLEGWSALDLGDGTTLDTAQIEQVKETAKRFFASKNPVAIDGVRQKPAKIQVEVLDISVAGLKVLKNPDALDRTTALLGVILSYPHRVLPSQVELNWQLFTDEAGVIPVRITDPAGGVPGYIKHDDPVVVWTNFLKSWQDPAVKPVTLAAGQSIGVPVLSVIFAGVCLWAVVAAFRSMSKTRWRWVAAALVSGLLAIVAPRLAVVSLPNPLSGSLDERSAPAVAESLLTNAGTALLEGDPRHFNDALATFVAPDRAEAVGAELERGLSVTLPSGALARTEKVSAVTIEKITDRDDGTGTRLLANWQALVSGGHWGHMHRRRLEFRALLDVAEVDGAWKLVDLTVISARPVT